MRIPVAVLSLAVVACVGVSSTVSAAPTPKEVVKDPLGDANAINDQGTGDGSFGDHVTPADASSVTDFTGISLSNDSKNLYVTFSTEVAAPATQGVGYRLRVNPEGAAGAYCLLFEVFYPGATDALAAAEAHLRDTCVGGDPVEVEVLGNMLVVSRKAHKAFAKGKILKAPQAHSFIYSGSSYPAGIPLPVMDTTKVGTDYKLVK